MPGMTDTDAPVLQMLWESGDPAEALGGRFGFRDSAAAGRWVAAVLDEHWGLDAVVCERIVMSAGNALAWVATPDGRVLAKWSVVPERFPRLAEVARLTGWLDDRGLPVSAPVPARDGRLQVEADAVSIGVQREVAGDLLDAGDPAQVRAAGAVLARLQEAMAVYPGADRLPGATWAATPLPDRVAGWLSARGGHLPAGLRNGLRERVAEAPPDRPAVQLVHYDVRSANVLCAGGAVTAVLDLEDAQEEHRLVELARAAVLIGTRFHDWGPVPAQVRAGFVDGYRTVRPLTPAEAYWLDLLVLWQTLAMVPAGDDRAGWTASALSQLSRLR
jgi:homoserine kinase type II